MNELINRINRIDSGHCHPADLNYDYQSTIKRSIWNMHSDGPLVYKDQLIELVALIKLILIRDHIITTDTYFEFENDDDSEEIRDSENLNQCIDGDDPHFFGSYRVLSVITRDKLNLRVRKELDYYKIFLELQLRSQTSAKYSAPHDEDMKGTIIKHLEPHRRAFHDVDFQKLVDWLYEYFKNETLPSTRRVLSVKPHGIKNKTHFGWDMNILFRTLKPEQKLSREFLQLLTNISRFHNEIIPDGNYNKCNLYNYCNRKYIKKN